MGAFEGRLSMTGRFAAVVLVFSWLPDCKGEGAPGAFEKFVPACDHGSDRVEGMARGHS